MNTLVSTMARGANGSAHAWSAIARLSDRIDGIRRVGLRASCVVAASFSMAGGGCAYQRDEPGVRLTQRGEFAAARQRVRETATSDPENRAYILDQMKLVSLGLAEGIPDAAEMVADRLNDRLRTQGLNDDTRFASVMLWDGATRIYKGDPFEQALAYYHIALIDALKGDWGNARAASQQSLFLLRDFSGALRSGGGTRDSDDAAALVRAAALAEREGKDGDSLGVDFVAVASDFEAGYLLRAIAARRLNEIDDMDEALRILRQVSPRLSPVASLISQGRYNTVFAVDHGVAPEKYGSGPDKAVAARAAITPSDDAPLVLSIGGESSEWPVATDVNRIAASTRWANLEDVRRAKSAIGSLLVTGGIITAATADDNDTQVMVGLIVSGVGALLKASSAADVQHNELFPQRMYLALADLNDPVNRVELAIGGRSPSRLVLPDVPAGPRGGLALHYIRMPLRPGPWAVADVPRYTNDVSIRRGDSAPDDVLPYILGGRDVQSPSLAVLRAYQASGHLAGFSVDDLIDLYREEGIRIAGLDGTWEDVGLHVLEGGSWLYTPAPASTAYKRLFYSDHPPYRPRSKRVESLRQQIQRQHSSVSVRGGTSPDPGTPGRAERRIGGHSVRIGDSRRFNPIGAPAGAGDLRCSFSCRIFPGVCHDDGFDS